MSASSTAGMLRSSMRGVFQTLSMLIAGARMRAALVAVLLTWAVAGPAGAMYQDSNDLIDRPVSEIAVSGLGRVSEQMISNNIRAKVGSPYDPQTVREDVRRLEALGDFRTVNALAELRDDGSVRISYVFVEQPLIMEVQTVDNKLLTDQQLIEVVPLVRGGPRDDFLVEQAKRNIQDLYRSKGHYLTTVEVDESELDETGILFFRIIEGPRVKVRAIEFEGNSVFTDRQLRPQVKTETAFPIFRKGALDDELLDADVASVDRFYKDRGYLDVRVDRRIELSPDNREAKVIFVLIEGTQYTLGTVKAQRLADGKPLNQFAETQLLAIMDLRPGDVYSQDKLRKSIRAIQDAYGVMGYYNAKVSTFELRRSDAPVVDLMLEIDEGTFVMLGIVRIQGNFLTKDKVIRREAKGLRPNRPLDTTELQRTQDRLKSTRLFNDPIRITLQEPATPDADYRDLLIEVKERDTGSVNFGVAVGSDSGVFGEISVDQRNFDIADLPESFEEFFRGRAFRGAGQRFQMIFRPGNEIFQYSVSVTEPHLLDSDYSVRVGGSFYRRIFREYDEQRISGTIGFGRKIGDFWQAGLDLRFENARLDNIEAQAPTEIFQDAGPDAITSVALSVTRTTITTIRRPGRGSRLELSYERVGALGGAFEFNKVVGEYTLFITLYEDFLERKTTLKLNTRAGYIFGGDRPPTYEQFYLGGRSMRGFDFRSVSPKGIRNDNGLPSDEAVGGEWMYFAGAQLEHPLLEDVITGVVFIDSGTVLDDLDFSNYRASIGVGLRLYIEQFGPVPIALDFAWPLLKEGTDETQLFSFTAELPF